METFNPNDLLLGHLKVYLSPKEAQVAAFRIAETHGIAAPTLIFESAIPDDVVAVCVKPETSDGCMIQFEHRGCQIELLAHELAHAIEFANGDEANRHDDAFALLTCLVGWQIMDVLVESWDYCGPVPLISRSLGSPRAPTLLP